MEDSSLVVKCREGGSSSHLFIVKQTLKEQIWHANKRLIE